MLETANSKLGSVASNVVGVSGRRMLEAIKRGEFDPQVLAELAKGRLREKLPALRLALDGRVQAHHQLLIGELLDHLDYLDRAIHRVEVNIAAMMAVAHSLLVSIYSMLRDQKPYQEVGSDYFDQLQAQHLERHSVRRLEALGFQVTLTSAS